jgi:hypothetical protein
MEWNGMEWNGMEWNGMEYPFLTYLAYKSNKRMPGTVDHVMTSDEHDRPYKNETRPSVISTSTFIRSM